VHSTDEYVFCREDHPGGAPPALVYARAVGVPLAVTMLPVMIVTLVAVLEGRPLTLLHLLGFVAALIAAFVWTAYQLRARVVEIRIIGEAVTVRTMLDVALGRRPENWYRLLDLRRTSGGFLIAIGDRLYEFDDADWPESPALLEALRTARHASGHAPAASASTR
jgi:hypothetical protein